MSTTNILSQNVPVFETQFAHLEIRDGILLVTYKRGITITLAMARQMIKERLAFTQYKPYPILVKDEGLVSVDKDARDFFSNEGTEGLTAGAFVIKSVYSAFFFNFYLRITSPKVPVKMFTDEIKALEWLRQYKIK